jgi:hypothetical protein
MDKEITKDFMSVKEFAKHIGLHPITINKYIKNGCINAFQIGPHKKSPYRIPVSELNRIAEFSLKKVIDKIVEDKNV